MIPCKPAPTELQISHADCEKWQEVYTRARFYSLHPRRASHGKDADRAPSITFSLLYDVIEDAWFHGYPDSFCWCKIGYFQSDFIESNDGDRRCRDLRAMFPQCTIGGFRRILVVLSRRMRRPRFWETRLIAPGSTVFKDEFQCEGRIMMQDLVWDVELTNRPSSIYTEAQSSI